MRHILTIEKLLKQKVYHYLLSSLMVLSLFSFLPQIYVYAEAAAKDAAVSEENLGKIMEEAKQTMASGDYRLAVQLYTKVLRYPNHKYLQDAQEFLGLANEMGGKLAHARANYKEYLRLYPSGEGADRVRQRLAGLETATAPRGKKRSDTRFYGGFSQYYNVSSNDIKDAQKNASSLTSSLNLTYQKHGAAYDIKYVFAGRDRRDFVDNQDSDFRLNYLYFDLDKNDQLSMRLGRQRGNSGGVLGRFDGALLGLPLNHYVKLNLVTGLPVDVNEKDVHKNRKYFYGLNFDLGTFADSWDFNVFVINQQVESLPDRQAVGGEARYTDDNKSFSALVDHDYYFNELNALLLRGNYTLLTDTALNFSYDYQKTPTLTTSNAMIGKEVDSPVELLDQRSRAELARLAKDRTPTSKSFFFGVSQPLNKNLLLDGDVTVAEMTGTKSNDSDGVRDTRVVKGLPATGQEYYYNVQLTGSSLLKEEDLAVLALRYNDGSSASTASCIINTRYPFTRNFRIKPKLRVDLRALKNKKEDILKLKPALGLDYRLLKRGWLELDLAVEMDRTVIGETAPTTYQFLSAGYRIDF